MMKCAKDLQSLFESDIQFNVAKSVADFDKAQRKEDHPLSQGLPLKSNNIFVDIVQFAMRENKELLHTILRHTVSNRTEFDEAMVIHIANIYTQMASKLNFKNNTFQKLKGIFLQSCGLTNVGLGALSQLGEVEAPRQLLDTRTSLAVADEEEMKKVAESSDIVIVIDNLDTQVNKVLQHKTLPVLLCRNVSEELDGLQNQGKTLYESMQNFNAEFLLLNSPSHAEEKESFLEVNFNYTTRTNLYI